MKIHQANSWGRRCWSREVKQELVEQFSGSGMSMAEFCRSHDLNPKTFSRWVREARRKDDTLVVRFQQVEVALPMELAQRQIEVLAPNQLRVLIPVGSIGELGAVLREVIQC